MFPKAFRNLSFLFSPLNSLLRPRIFCFSNEKFKFSEVVNIFNKFSEEKRSEIISDLNQIFINSLKKYDKETNFNLIRILICKMNNASTKTKMGLGDKLFIKIIATHFGVAVEKANEDFKKIGEVGLLAAHYFQTLDAGKNNVEELDINFISSAIGELYNISGKGSLDKKGLQIMNILNKCKTADEVKFVFRILKGELKIGLGESSVIKALNEIKDTDVPIKMSDFMNDLQMIVFKRSLAEEKNSIIKPGLPIVLMAGRSAESIETLLQYQTFLNLNGDVVCEYKYDGERSQIHYANGIIQAFSRSHENQTQNFKNLLAKLKNHLESLKITSCIIDCELVGFDYEKQKVLEFQDFRKKKNFGPNDLEAKIYPFDIVYYNDKILINEPLIYRQNILSTIPQLPFFERPKSFNINLFEEEFPKVEQDVLQFLYKAIEEGYEGIMIKTTDKKLSHYDGKTRTLWTKLKKNALQGGLPDSFDLVPIGVYWGKGRKSGHYSSFLLASFNKITNKYEPLCRIGSGFSDEMLTILSFKLQNTVLKDKPSIYETSNESPDHWIAPTQVWEVYCDSFSQSEYYSVGKESLKKGISLRFPRFSRIRDDKNLYEVTTSQDLLELFMRIEENKIKKEIKS